MRAGVDIDAAGLLHGAAEGEGLRDVVGFVFEQGLFDEQIEVGFGKTEAAAGFEGCREGGGDGVGDVGDELAVDVGEDGGFVLLAGNEQVGERVADGVGDVFEGEMGIDRAAGDDDVRIRRAFLGRQDLAPGEAAVEDGEGEAVGDDLLEEVVFVGS